MADPIEFEKLPPILKFIPWPPGDPGPDWRWILQGLDKSALHQIGLVQVQLQKSILEAQIKALDQIQGVLRGK